MERVAGTVEAERDMQASGVARAGAGKNHVMAILKIHVLKCFSFKLTHDNLYIYEAHMI